MELFTAALPCTMPPPSCLACLSPSHALPCLPSWEALQPGLERHPLPSSLWDILTCDRERQQEGKTCVAVRDRDRTVNSKQAKHSLCSAPAYTLTYSPNTFSVSFFSLHFYTQSMPLAQHCRATHFTGRPLCHHHLPSAPPSLFLSLYSFSLSFIQGKRKLHHTFPPGRIIWWWGGEGNDRGTHTHGGRRRHGWQAVVEEMRHAWAGWRQAGQMAY